MFLSLAAPNNDRHCLTARKDIMSTLYVTEPGAQVHKSNERLVIQKEKQVIDEIPLIKVDQLVLVGRSVSLTTSALFALAGRGVDVIYLTGRGKFVSRMVGEEHKNARLRHLQALKIADPAFCLAIVRTIVAGKIRNQKTLIQRHLEQAAWGTSALGVMDEMAARVNSARSVDELRGVEGTAAREYFNILRRLLLPPADGGSWGFEKRAYYPPTDPVNALLSFGYSLLLKDIQTASQQIGLDPYLGCFHVIDYGRPSMSLDLMEEFRPVIVDSIVLQLINRRLVHLADFEVHTSEDNEDKPEKTASQGIWLKEQGRNHFIEAYETRINQPAQHPLSQNRETYRRIYLLQAQQMARLILGETNVYIPFQVR
jgi:CRISP-associated protein Cas1